MWGTLDFITAPPLPWGAGIQFHYFVSISHPVPDEGPSYDPIALELKWQRLWQERRTNEPDLKAATSPFYQLMMFPYPSAEGLHVGNVFAFTGADIHGRFQRLQGNSVFEPMGFDAFGIHSENYALKVGGHPMRLIPQNIENFRRQLRRVGLMIDWKHELSTTDARYYKWTQWIFLQLFKQGLAYKKKAAVNWCPNDKTVLANEQVENGLCERCGASVEQRLLEQWFFRITDYAERLLHNLEWIDWSETTKSAQRNWIGRSEGAEISFAIAESDAPPVVVFTTRPDTIFGATYLVLAPEHPQVAALTTDKERARVEAYRTRTAQQDVVSRKMGESAQKTGAFTGSYATNPATGERIPIWIADYVLMEYGTGAIMAVPGHDERDFAFAQAYELPIIRVVVPDDADASAPLSEAYTGEGRLVNSGMFDGVPTDEATARTTEWLPVPEDQLPVILPDVQDFRPDDTGISPLARHEEWYRVPCPKCGKLARRETDVSDTFLDSAWYFLRYPSADRDDVPFDREITKKWLPVHSYIGGNEHAVLHLLYSRFITMVLHDMGHLTFEEPYTRFRAHGLIIRDGAKMSKTKGNVVNPDEYVERWGADTFRTYLMFLGPFEEGGDFRDAGISGVRRFLDRLWKSSHDAVADGAPDVGVMRKLHQTIRKVGDDTAKLSYNTAIAAMMEYMNVLRASERTAHRAEVEPLVQLVAPFAPHIAEELWEYFGHTGGVFESRWPSYDPALATVDEIELVVQVNGKVRGKIHAARDITEAAALALAREDAGIARFLNGAPKKVIFVPGRLLNIVV